MGVAADEWPHRFDGPEDQLQVYWARLLDEVKLTKETTLPAQL